MIEMNMTERQLKKLTRKQLLELLIKQTEEVERLQEKLSTTEKMLHQRTIMIKEAGSIAEASLKLNNIFEIAQNTANQYLENIERLNKNQESLCNQLEEEARLKTKSMIEETEKKCLQREKQADNHLKIVSKRLDELYNQYQSEDANLKNFS